MHGLIPRLFRGLMDVIHYPFLTDVISHKVAVTRLINHSVIAAEGGLRHQTLILMAVPIRLLPCGIKCEVTVQIGSNTSQSCFVIALLSGSM
jgi:hypothetical protein